MKYRIDIFSDCGRWAALVKRVYVEVESAEQALQIAKNTAKQGQGYEIMQVAQQISKKFPKGFFSKSLCPSGKTV